MSKSTDELKKLDAAKLTERIAQLRVELVEQKRAKSAGELTNPMAVRKTRRMIATGLTFLAQNQQTAAKAEPKEVK